MAANPCSRTSACKHRVVLSLPQVRVLDGDPVDDLDRDLARMHSDKGATAAPASARSAGGGSSEAGRDGAAEAEQRGEAAVCGASRRWAHP